MTWRLFDERFGGVERLESMKRMKEERGRCSRGKWFGE